VVTEIGVSMLVGAVLSTGFGQPPNRGSFKRRGKISRLIQMVETDSEAQTFSGSAGYLARVKIFGWRS